MRKRIAFTVALLLLPCLSFGQGINPVGAVTRSAAPAGGPNVWYYAGGGASNSFTSEQWVDNDQAYGGKIVIGTGGSLTKLAFLSVQARTGNHYLYITDSSNNKLGCKIVSNSGAGWMEATLDTPITVTTSQEVRVYVVQATGGDNSFGTYSKTSTGNGMHEYASYGGANMCAQTSISPDDTGVDETYGVAVYVD